jgi:transketolase
MGKADLGAVHAAPPLFDWGKLCPVAAGSGQLAWIATGSMVTTAIAAAADWPDSDIWSAPCIKPLDAEQVAAICRWHDAVIVLEEHSIHGGLGSAVAEIAAAAAPTWICRVGIADRFSERCGSHAYLMREHGLDVASVQSQVSRFLTRAGRDVSSKRFGAVDEPLALAVRQAA